jgi:hypothetical protein
LSVDVDGHPNEFLCKLLDRRPQERLIVELSTGRTPRRPEDDDGRQPRCFGPREGPFEISRQRDGAVASPDLAGRVGGRNTGPNPSARELPITSTTISFSPGIICDWV